MNDPLEGWACSCTDEPCREFPCKSYKPSRVSDSIERWGSDFRGDDVPVINGRMVKYVDHLERIVTIMQERDALTREPDRLLRVGRKWKAKAENLMQERDRLQKTVDGLIAKYNVLEQERNRLLTAIDRARVTLAPYGPQANRDACAILRAARE